MTKLVYVGWADTNTYIGPVTGTGYEFGLLTRRKGFVDNRDIGLLGVREDGAFVFEVGR